MPVPADPPVVAPAAFQTWAQDVADTAQDHEARIDVVEATGYYAPGGTDVAVADGGTGASTAAAARTNLGVPADGDVVHDTGAETIAGVKTFSSDPLIPDEAYGAGWDGSLEPPTKNAVYDKVEALVPKATFPVTETLALSDEATAITTGTAKVTWRAPWAFTLTAVRASLNTASSSGIPTVDINEGGTTILSTKLTIDANEKTSTTAAAAAVISDSAIADDAELTFDIDVAGTGAKGLKVTLIGTRSI